MISFTIFQGIEAHTFVINAHTQKKQKLKKTKQKKQQQKTLALN